MLWASTQASVADGGLTEMPVSLLSSTCSRWGGKTGGCFSLSSGLSRYASCWYGPGGELDKSDEGAPCFHSLKTSSKSQTIILSSCGTSSRRFAVLKATEPEKSAVSSESILRASNTSKSVLFTWMVLLTTPVFEVVTAWRVSTLALAVLVFWKRRVRNSHSPRWDPASSGRPRRTCTGARPRADPQWPRSCSDCRSKGEREGFSAQSEGTYESSHTFGLGGFLWPSCWRSPTRRLPWRAQTSGTQWAGPGRWDSWLRSPDPAARPETPGSPAVPEW